MKKIALMMLLAIAAIACNPEEQIVPEIKVTTTEFTLPLAGTEDMSFKVQFNANVDWTAALKETTEWCTITPASGVAGDASVTVIALENPTEEERTVTLVLTAGTAVEEIVLTQEAVFIPRLATTPADGVNVPQAGGSASVEVAANVAYTVTVDAEATWLTVAQDGNTVTMTATANEEYAARGANVTFATEYEGVGATVYVYQEGRATKLWTKKVAELEGFDANMRVRLAKYGDLLAVANTTKVYVQFLPAAVTGCHLGQLFPGYFIIAQGFQLVIILPVEIFHSQLLVFPAEAAGFHHCRQQTHVGDIQHPAATQQRKTSGCQQHHLGDFIFSQIAHAFQSRLEDLPVIPVDILLVVDLLHNPGLLRGVLHNGQCHVRLQGQQPSAAVGEGNDLIRHQKILIPHIQIIFFKPAHFIRNVSITAVELLQRSSRLLFIFPDRIRHPEFPLFSSCPAPSDSRCRN